MTLSEDEMPPAETLLNGETSAKTTGANYPDGDPAIYLATWTRTGEEKKNHWQME